MSLTLATVADALIEFILSLLRDPEAAAEFEADPDGMLAQRGLNQATANDVSSVAPVIIERTFVVHAAKPAPVEYHANPVVREIKQVTSQFQWVDDRDTVVDQSVNQNIWTEGGDLSQSFDQEAIVASGDEALAAGDDIDYEETNDLSTDIEAGEDVNIGNETDITDIDDSFDEDTDTSTETDAGTDIVVEDSGNDESTDVVVDGSGNTTTETIVDAVTGGGDVVVEAPVEEAPVEEVVEEPVEEPVEDPYADAAAQYDEMSVDVEQSDSFEQTDTMLPTETANDDDL